MFDFNTKLGHWPYRPLKGLHDLLTAMDRHGIERAAVSSLSAVHYLNPQDGNDELLKLIAPHRDRFIPFAVLKPDFTGWLDDLDACLNESQVRGVVLYPNYHEFRLNDPALVPLMDIAQRAAIPVCVQVGLEDIRRQFRSSKTEEVPTAEIGEFARAYPNVTIVALGLKHGQPQRAGDPLQAGPLPPNFYFDTSNYETLGELESAVEHFGADRILLGSNFPLFNARANVDKLQCADLTDAARRAIAQGNAHTILGLK